MKCPKCHKEVEKGAAEPPIRKKTENQNYKIFQASKKKKAEIQQKTASMSASVCGDTAGVLLLSAVKYFFCLIFQGKKTICTAKL